nr:hypothetical protein [Roseateles depolymerans]
MQTIVWGAPIVKAAEQRPFFQVLDYAVVPDIGQAAALQGSLDLQLLTIER